MDVRLPTTDRRRLRRHAGFPEGTVVKNPPARAGDAEVRFLPGAGNIPWREEGEPIPVF